MEIVATLDLDQLLEPKYILRELNRQSAEYLELRDGIRELGLTNCGCARYTEDPDKFEIVDGWFRFNAIKDLGHKSMPFILQHLTDSQALAKQVSAQAHRPETTPVQMARHLKLLQLHSPEMRLSDLAASIQKSPDWVSRTLGLLNLLPGIQELVDGDRMATLNAYMLAKLPPSWQGNYIEHAKHMNTREFSALMRTVLRDMRLDHRAGRLKAKFKSFEAIPHLRTVNEILAELASSEAANTEVNRKRDPRDAWDAALKWVLHLDDKSKEKQRRLAEDRNQKHEIERKAYVEAIDSVVPDP